MDLRQMRDYYQSILDKVQSSPKAVEALEKAIKNLNVEITKEGQKTIIDSLNSELSKLKDEYELAVELDANPELGGVFADMMGLSKEELEKLPRDFEGVVRKLQNVVDKEMGMGAFDVRSNLNKDVFDQWVKANKYSQDSELVAKLKALTEYANKVRLDETKKQIEDWNKLLEKYAEYEYKRNKIMEDAEKEREVARKRNASDEIMSAIDLKERRQLAQLNFEQFQQSPEWIAATSDLATFTNRAINSLIHSLEEYKKKAKNLDPKQIKQINNALKSLYREQRKGNPFLSIANALDEAKSAAAPFIEEVDRLKERQDELIRKRASAEGGVFISKKELKELDELPDKIQEAEDKAKKFGKVSATAIVEGIQGMQGAINQVTGGISEMFSAFGNTEVSENIQKVTQVLDKAASFAAMGAQVGGGWGAAIGGVVGGLMGAVTAWADEISGNAAITRQVETSERVVKRLEMAYINLERAVENAYGTEEAYAQRVATANKQAQLAELKRQLQLEKSRSDKRRDQDKILDLQRQILELQNEIDDNLKSITNDLLGVSSVGDAVEDMVSNIIEALRNGEDAMASFDDSIDDMIVNMIKKIYSSKVLGPWFESLWNEVNSSIEDRTTEYRNDLAKYKDLRERLLEGYSKGQVSTLGLWLMHYQKQFGGKQEGENWLGYINRIIEITEQKLKDASEVTMQDVEKLAELANEGKPLVAEQIDELSEILQRLGLTKDEATAKLSNLQQGIQGITEDTASALEAYMNSVSQQVYLHSTQLEEIKALMQGWNFDVSLGTMSQVLLQLQNSYQVQMTIQNTLLGWSSPNGMSVRVEMV